LSSLRKIPVILFFFFLFSAASGSDPYKLSAGAGEAGMGNVCVMRSAFWSSFQNQALLAFNKSFSAGFNYDNRFGVKELGNRTAGIIAPAGKASLGAVYNYFGYPDFRRQFAGIACGLSLSEKVAAGVQVDYFSEKTYGEYGDSQMITFEAGLVSKVGENTIIAIHVFNPLPSSMNKMKMPSRLRIGVGTTLGSSVFAGAEAEMSTGGNLILRTGVEYEMMKSLWLRGGFSTDNNAFSFGLGYRLSFVQLDLGFVTHEKLGVSSVASLIFLINR
jgi:hypothetical protein